MRPASIQRQLMFWGLGALALCAPLLMVAAYFLTLHEIDEALDDSLQQTTLLLADRDLTGVLPSTPAPASASTPPDLPDTESMLVAIARHRDGTLLFCSRPEDVPRFEATPGASLQRADGARWHVYTLVQADRVLQVAQPESVRREVAAESASKLLLPLAVLISGIAALLAAALRRGLRPLGAVNAALARRHAGSLAPLQLHDVPVELRALVETLNGLLRHLADALDAQRNFIADAAHELRSPVTALQLQVQVFEGSSDPEERAAAAAELGAGITRVRHLIEQLLYLSRATSVDGGTALAVEPVDLAALVREGVVRWSREAERRGIDLGADAPGTLTVSGDTAQLEILLNNLIDNALRYTPGGGVVDVRAAVIDGAPTLQVIDNGPGIAPVDRERVFDRFFRSPDAVARGEHGSGLGLAIVRAIAGRHRAALTLHDPGRGLEVRVAFPRPT